MSQQATWQEVPKDRFFATVGPTNSHPSIVGSYPYTSLFKLPSGFTTGKIVGDKRGDSRYYLPVREDGGA